MSFVFLIIHRFWSVEEFWEPLKTGDNDFHPQATTGVRLSTDLSIAAQSVLQSIGYFFFIGST